MKMKKKFCSEEQAKPKLELRQKKYLQFILQRDNFLYIKKVAD